MAKKETKEIKEKKGKKQPKNAPVSEMPDNQLPQNILPMGERVEENKNIYISQSVYKQIHKFTKNKTTNESGGMLVGSVIEELGKTNIVISGFVEAKYCDATPTTLKFTHETWDYVHKEIDKKYKDQKIVGWIHTHPDFGIFLSEYDKFIHENFFSEAHQVAYVVDPIQKIEGFYFWINGNLEKCKGFYIYDKTGTPITVDSGKEEPEEEKAAPLLSVKNLLIAVLSVAVIFLAFSNSSTNKHLQQLESELAGLTAQQTAIVTSISQILTEMQAQIEAQADEIDTLKANLIEAGVIAAPQTEGSDIEGGNTDPTDATDPTDGTEPTDATEPTQAETTTNE